ncbi:FtsW/RodA/SpoVE family cell cycle protein [Pontibacillus yanchengensis]|uniref:Cell division protein FtsW n=1 Tax=Pontibacillus yanchengensis Y32 TaxID=1385514 RepID=A0A0A2TYP0_9BACI|nr:FtsW/RodA/SpoVE family cell cycle protein [Pontibacillus yanchengensis]KGP74340.1 cell division protein FtsW [Pontibacillus yanchengensis Y32]
MNQKNQGFNIDFTLIFIILLLAAVSLFSLYTIQPTLPSKYDGTNFLMQQTQWYILGTIVVISVMLIDYERFRQFAWVIYGLGVMMLLMLELNIPSFLVHSNNGATSWFKLPFGTIQPGEFMKVFLVIIQSHLIARHHEKRPDYQSVKYDLWLLAKLIGVALPPMALIAKQPDLGTFLVMAAITGALILVSGVRWRILLTIIGIIGISAAAFVTIYLLFPLAMEQFLTESDFGHVTGRFYGWLQPEKYEDYGYQLTKAMMAIGSGQLLGKGVMGMQSLNIPERHTDMIFTAIAEQFGFLGASVVVTLFFLLIYRLISTALESNDQFGSYLCVGIIGLFTYQIFQNIGMSIQLLPITGLPLPFLSYGGSSLLTYMLAIAIVLNVRFRTKTYMFD